LDFDQPDECDVDKTSNTSKEDAPEPKRIMEEGEAIPIEGGSSNYEVRLRGGVYYCTCMGWKIQKKAIDERTCKHLKQVLGEEFEQWRTGGVSTSPKKDKGSKDNTGKSSAPKLLLAHKWDADKHDPTGWWISEKLDGVRGYWNGSKFLSRLGKYGAFLAVYLVFLRSLTFCPYRQ